MTQQEFLEKWNISEDMIRTNSDFKMILMSNLSDLQFKCDVGYNVHTLESHMQNDINQIKSFIIDFYDAQPKSVDIDFLHPLTETK